MAKGAKQAKSDRQKRIDDVRRKQKGADRRRGMAIVGVSVTIAVVIIGAAAFQPLKTWWDDRQFNDIELASIGAAADVCGEIETADATGNADHRPTSEQVVYEDSPPAYGPHWNEFNLAPDPIDRKFYEVGDRPELESLVHNAEHGYTILWYDESIADDDEQLAEIRGIARKLDGDDDNFRLKFKAVPWTSEDGEPFPNEQSIAFTHWSVAEDGDDQTQEGIWQYCSEVSGEALQQFMLDYPYTDSPEPNAG